MLAAGSTYCSYSPTSIVSSQRANRPSLGANIRFPFVSNISSTYDSILFCSLIERIDSVVVSLVVYRIPMKSSSPSITFQLRFQVDINVLFVTIVQLHDYMPSRTKATVVNMNMHRFEHVHLDKTGQNMFVILYLLPNDDEQRQTSLSTNGIFNEHFQFSVWTIARCCP
jgi:hypothetical protein